MRGGMICQAWTLQVIVIAAKAGIRFLPNMDPRFRGGDLLTFTCVGGPLAHDDSE